jgi:hypothetical protein
MIIDLLAPGISTCSCRSTCAPAVLRLFRLFRLLKLLRYSPALLTLKRVIAHEYRALLGAILS